MANQKDIDKSNNQKHTTDTEHGRKLEKAQNEKKNDKGEEPLNEDYNDPRQQRRSPNFQQGEKGS